MQPYINEPKIIGPIEGCVVVHSYDEGATLQLGEQSKAFAIGGRDSFYPPPGGYDQVITTGNVTLHVWRGKLQAEEGPGPRSGKNFVVDSAGNMQVVGTTADGAAATGNPVQVAGVDGGGNVETLLTDTSGRPQVVGAAAAGAAVAGNPVQVAGSDGANVRALLTDASGREIVVGAAAAGAAVAGNPVLAGVKDTGGNAQPIAGDTSGRQMVVGAAAAGAAVAGNPVQVAGSDGANVRALLTDTSGREIVVGAAAAGAAVAGSPVLAGLKDTGGNAQPIAGDTSGRQMVVGAAAAGAAVAGNPVLAGLKDTGGNAQPIAGDTSGRQMVVGAAADAGSPTGNPVWIGGSDGFNFRGLKLDSSGRQIAVGAAQSGTAVAGNPVLVGGFCGSDNTARQLATDAAGRIITITGDGQIIIANAVTSPAAASTVAGTTVDISQTGYNKISLIARIRGATGGTLDVYIQTGDGTVWWDVAHFTQLAAAAALTAYAISIERGNGGAIATINAVDGTPSLAAGTVVHGILGTKLRYVFVAGAGTSAGASQDIRGWGSA